MAFRTLHLGVAVLGIASVLATVYWWPQAQRLAPAPAQGQREGAKAAVPVEAGWVTAVRMADETQAVGSLRSRQTVIVRPEVSGRISQLNFRDGAPVRQGQLLVQFDNQLELAQLRQSEAELVIARTNHQRNQELAARSFISASAVDQSDAALQVAQAKHALAEATVARLRILAPFDGITGIANVNVGDYLSAGQEVVSLDDMAAMFVDYRLPERYQTRLAAGQLVRVSLDALPGQAFDARVLAIAPRIDPEGRSIGVRACIDNHKLLLRPGMFARIQAVFEIRDHVVVVPEEAVELRNGLSYIYRIQPEAEQTFYAERLQVQLGSRRQGQVEIVEPVLRPGERVVLAGQLRLGEGRTRVTVNEAALRLPAPQGGQKDAMELPNAPARPIAGLNGRAAQLVSEDVVGEDLAGPSDEAQLQQIPADAGTRPVSACAALAGADKVVTPWAGRAAPQRRTTSSGTGV